MQSAARFREDCSAEDLRSLATVERRQPEPPGIVSLCGCGRDASRPSSQEINGMERETLRETGTIGRTRWADRLVDNWAEGSKPRPSAGSWPNSRPSSSVLSVRQCRRSLTQHRSGVSSGPRVFNLGHAAPRLHRPGFADYRAFRRTAAAT